MDWTTKAALLATTLLAPATAFAQSAAPAQNACDQLIVAIDRAGTQTIVTRQQALDYQARSNNAACNTALIKLNPQAAVNATATGASTSGATTAAGGGSADNNVQVSQAAPKVTVTQQPPTVTVNQGQPEITIHQPAPIVSVEIPPPDVTVRLPTPNVSVSQAQPQVAVTEAKPQVTVVPPAQQAQAITSGQQNPQVQFTADKAQVTVTQSDKPTIHVEQQTAAATAGQTGTQSQAALGQLKPQQVAVQDIVGKNIVSGNNSDVGKVTEVVMDSANRSFAVVDKDGKQYAVDLTFAYMKNGQLMLNTDPSKLPMWTDAQLQTSGTHKLNNTQMVTVAEATG